MELELYLGLYNWRCTPIIAEHPEKTWAQESPSWIPMPDSTNCSLESSI